MISISDIGHSISYVRPSTWLKITAGQKSDRSVWVNLALVECVESCSSYSAIVFGGGESGTYLTIYDPAERACLERALQTLAIEEALCQY
jgi:hypothetical protein